MNRVRRRLAVVVPAVALLVASQVCGKDKFAWDEVTEADWAVAEDSAAGIRDAAIIFEKIIADDADLQDDQRCYRTLYRRIRILSEAGRSWGDVEAPIYDKDQKIEFVLGRTLLRDGSEILLSDDHVFEKQAIKYKGDKVKQTAFSMPSVTDDCIIEYAVRYRLENPVAEWVFQNDICVQRAELHWILAELTMTRSWADALADFITPNYLWLNTAHDVEVTQLPNLKQPESLVFVATNIPPFETEPYAVPDAVLKAKLITYYGSKDPPATYWGEQATNLVKRLDRFSEKDKKLKEVTDEISEFPDPQEQIRAAFNWVQDHLTNLTYFDLYDDGKNKKPRKRESVNDVIKRGYGNRTDINMVFCDILRELNIDARMAWAETRFDDLFVFNAKFWQFDNSLVAVKNQDGGYDFYAPGNYAATFDQVPWFVQGVMALVGGAEELMVPVPFAEASLNSEIWQYAYVVNEDMGVTGQLQSRLLGQRARDLRMAVHDEDSTDFGALLLDEVDDDFESAEIEITGYEGLDEINDPLELSGTIVQPDLAPAGGRILLKPFELFMTMDNPFHAPERELTILFDHSVELRESAQIELPPGWTVEALPGDTTYANLAGSCGASLTTFGSTISAQRNFILNSPFWRTDQYPLVQELFQNRHDMADLIVVLRHSDESGSSAHN